MSKAAAIHTAICIQMASEAKTVPVWTATLDNAGYAEATIRGFLANVASRLRADTPPWVFNWSGLNPDHCLTSQLWVVEQDIAAATSAVPTAEPKDPPKP